MNKRNSIAQKIDGLLNSDNSIEKYANKDINELLNEISVYHEELHFQNDELNRIKQKLAKSNEHFKILFEEAPVSYILTDKDFIIKKVNKNLAELINNKDIELNKTKLSSLIHPDSQDKFYFFCRSLLVNNSANSTEIELNNDFSIPVLIEGKILYSDNQLLLHFAISDLTSLKKYENELKSTKNRFQKYIDNSPIPLFITDKHSNYKYVNKAACVLLEYNKFHLENMNLMDVSSKDLLEYPDSKFKELDFSDKISDYESVLIKRTGEKIFVSIDAIKLSDNEYISFYRDITSEKKYKQSIVENQENLKIRTKIAESIITKSGDRFFYDTLHLIMQKFESRFGYFGYLNENGDLVCPSMTYDIWETCNVQNKTNIFPRENWSGVWGESLIQKKDLIKNFGLEVPDGHIQLDNAIAVLIRERENIIGQIVLANRPEGYTDEDLTELKKICSFISPLLRSTLIKNKTEKEIKIEKIRAEENEKRYISLFENMTEGFALHKLIIDKKGNPKDYIFLNINSAFEKLTGLKKEKVIGKKVTEVIPGIEKDKSSWIQKYGKVALENSQIEFEEYSDAIGKWFRIKAYSPEEMHFATIIEDVTDRLNSYKKIYESEEKLRTIYENSSVGIFLTDNNWEIIYANTVFCDMLEYEKENLYKLNYMDFSNQEDLEKEKSLISEMINGEINSYSIEKRYISDSDSEIWTQVSVSAVKDSDNNITNYSGVVKDISEKKKTEKALIENQRLSAIGEMASAVAHDFNNSLQSIFGNLELAIKKEMSEEVRNYIQTVKTAAEDAATRVELLQRFSGKKINRSDYKPFYVNKLLNDVIVQTRPIWKDSAEKDGIKIKIVKDFQQEIGINGNENEIRSVIYNLIKNSVESMPEGGILKFTTELHKNEINIRILDTGIGMDSFTKKRVFQPFFTTKGYELGRGLGMSSAYTIIKEHKGNIDIIDSSKNKGTTIEITFPILREITTNPTQEKQSQIKDLNILWVDDEKTIRDSSINLLEHLGHKGTAVSNGKSALELLEKASYDLVITDIGMPEMNGWQLAEIINKKYNGKIKVAVLTGWGSQIEEEKKEEYGVIAILGKPFRMSELKSLLNDIFKK